MFTIQYQGVNGESKTCEFESNNRFRLAKHLTHFHNPILAVYEQATPVTKAIRSLMSKNFSDDVMTTACRDFISSRD